MATFGERVARLRTDKGISQAKLARAMGVGPAIISHIEKNRRTPGIQLALRLTKFFEVTLDDLIDKEDPALHIRRDKHVYPEKYAARLAVANAINHGKLHPASFYKCHGCDQQAQQWHHESYLPEDRLCVVPLCRSCHSSHHSGRKPLSFGVVPTQVGLIRLAISN
jgi:transcriptional regulator with XRE-family HTH domain